MRHDAARTWLSNLSLNTKLTQSADSSVERLFTSKFHDNEQKKTVQKRISNSSKGAVHDKKH